MCVGSLMPGPTYGSPHQNTTCSTSHKNGKYQIHSTSESFSLTHLPFDLAELRKGEVLNYFTVSGVFVHSARAAVHNSVFSVRNSLSTASGSRPAVGMLFLRFPSVHSKTVQFISSPRPSLPRGHQQQQAAAAATAGNGTNITTNSLKDRR